MTPFEIGRVLEVFTLNIWGLPRLLTVRKAERIAAVRKALLKGNYDIICLQELWSFKDFKFINASISHVYSYSHYFYSGVQGSGLCIFSKWPIEDVMFFQWPLNGYIHMVHHADWFGGKGVGLVRLNVDGLSVNVYNCHLHAKYSPCDTYLAHRVVQAFDTASFVRFSSNNVDLCIVTGDFNAEPGEICQRMIQYGANLRDTFYAKDNQFKFGTNESSRNSFRTQKGVPSNPLGNRIDYIMYRTGLRFEAESISYEFPLEERVPGTDFSYSDHEAVSAVIQIVAKGTSLVGKELEDLNTSRLVESVEECLAVCSQGISDVKTKALLYWFFTSLFFLFIIIVPSCFELSPMIYFFEIMLTLLISFTALMASLWQNIECNALLGARNRMKVLLNNINNRED